MKEKYEMADLTGLKAHVKRRGKFVDFYTRRGRDVFMRHINFDVWLRMPDLRRLKTTVLCQMASIEDKKAIPFTGKHHAGILDLKEAHGPKTLVFPELRSFLKN